MGVRLKASDVEKLRETKTYMVGRLGNRNEFEEPIVIDSNGFKFYIVPLCKEPDLIEDINDFLPTGNAIPFYVGFESNLKEYLPVEYKWSKLNEKNEILENLFKDKMIVFKTNIRPNEEVGKNIQTDGYKEYKIFKNIEIVDIIDNRIDNNVKITCIPKLNMKERDFILKLEENNHIELLEYSTYLDSPRYIMCGDNIYYFESGDLEKHKINKNMWTYKGNIKNIIVIPIKKEEIIYNLKYVTCIMDDTIENPSNVLSVQDVSYTEEDENEYKELYSTFNKHHKKEIEFLKGLDIYCKQKSLLYKYEDLVNLHISIKTNFITIISGMTGTGKSQLAWAYSKMLDATIENENLLFVPISCNYMEPGDILGYFNPNIGMYISSEIELVDFLVRAQNTPEKQFIVIFDEMNLSQVEHWFSPFLSLLESEENNRFLSIYSKNNRCINDEKYPHKIKIGNNVRIIGTINLDETVKEFSERLLDRTNIIQLQKIRFSELSQYNLKTEEDEFYEKYICSDVIEYNNWISKYNTIDVLKKKLDFFDQLHDIISTYDSKKGVSFRVLDSIAKYIASIPIDKNENSLINESGAIDLQVSQRIISKLKGNQKSIINLIGEYDDTEDKVINSKIIDFLNQETNKSISDFQFTKKLLKEKSKELYRHGYTY